MSCYLWMSVCFKLFCCFCFCFCVLHFTTFPDKGPYLYNSGKVLHARGAIRSSDAVLLCWIFPHVPLCGLTLNSQTCGSHPFSHPSAPSDPPDACASVADAGPAGVRLPALVGLVSPSVDVALSLQLNLYKVFFFQLLFHSHVPYVVFILSVWSRFVCVVSVMSLACVFGVQHLNFKWINNVFTSLF